MHLIDPTQTIEDPLEAMATMRAEVMLILIGVVQYTAMCVGNGTMGLAHMGLTVRDGTAVGLAMTRESQVSSTRPQLMRIPAATQDLGMISMFSSYCLPSPQSSNGIFRWSTADFIFAHNAVVRSGRHNYLACRIPIPTAIRHDRLREALGSQVSSEELKVLSLIEYGIPIDCKENFGIQKVQKNHYSALAYRKEVEQYLGKGLESQAILGPFEEAPINNLCYSPLMTVPKEESKRRVVVDFSFPAGRSINDGIPKVTYLDVAINFSLPSVQSMVCRLNSLGYGCLMYKRDLKGAFRQFNIDPGDYRYTGLRWDSKSYIDTRLAMGLRSAAYCCQSVTGMVAKIANRKSHVLVYLDDFGGAELAADAPASFDHLGWLLKYFGFEEAIDKAVAPTTAMDWLGVHFNTVEWTMALKTSKLEELLDFLPKLLCLKRVKKVLLQKVLGSLVWASAVVRSGVVFFNRLLALLRKLKRPGHSIYFSKEARKDVKWWIAALQQFKGKVPIPPAVWIPLTSFYTDASLEGFGIVWGTRALAGLFPLEYDEVDISKKEMLTVMCAVKHWFADLANSRVKIFIDNQACVALLNHGVTRSPFLAACLREINYFLAMFNIEIFAEYIPSRDNYLADLCSRAFLNDSYFIKFNDLLRSRTIVLENVLYENLYFQYDF